MADYRWLRLPRKYTAVKLDVSVDTVYRGGPVCIMYFTARQIPGRGIEVVAHLTDARTFLLDTGAPTLEEARKIVERAVTAYGNLKGFPLAPEMVGWRRNDY